MVAAKGERYGNDLAITYNHLHTFVGCLATLKAPTVTDHTEPEAFHSPLPLQSNPGLPSEAIMRLTQPPPLSQPSFKH